MENQPLEVGDVIQDFETQEIHVRCVNCKKEITTTWQRMTKKFRRAQDDMWLMDQWNIKIPFTHIEFTITKWSVHKRDINWQKRTY